MCRTRRRLGRLRMRFGGCRALISLMCLRVVLEALLVDDIVGFCRRECGCECEGGMVKYGFALKCN